MENKPILTVAIPTYNRPHTLEKLLKQFQDEDENKFRILVSDDTSPDDPTNMVNKYQKVMPNLSYHRNERNLGFSGNVCQLYDMVETPFVWFLCDDDTIVPGCINEIVDSLEKYDPTVAVYNHSWINPLGLNQVAGVTKDKIYTSENEIKDYQILMRMTFLSTLVLKRILPSDEIRKSDYNSNVFVQVSLGLILLSKEFKYAEIASLVIKRNVGYKYGDFFKFYVVDSLRAIFGVKHDLNKKGFVNWAIREIPTGLQLYLSQKLGIFQYKGWPTKRTIKEIFQYYGIYSLAILSFIPIYYLTPTFLLKWLYKRKLYALHGEEKGLKIYNENINRAYKDERKTGFTEYR